MLLYLSCVVSDQIYILLVIPRAAHIRNIRYIPAIHMHHVHGSKLSSQLVRNALGLPLLTQDTSMLSRLVEKTCSFLPVTAGPPSTLLGPVMCAKRCPPIQLSRFTYKDDSLVDAAFRVSVPEAMSKLAMMVKRVVTRTDHFARPLTCHLSPSQRLIPTRAGKVQVAWLCRHLTRRSLCPLKLRLVLLKDRKSVV